MNEVKTVKPVLTDLDVAKIYCAKFQSCKERGISWEITLGQLKQLLGRKTCYYTGHVFFSDDDPNNVPSLERKDPTIGYTKENTVLVTRKVNNIKGCLLENKEHTWHISLPELTKMVQKLNE